MSSFDLFSVSGTSPTQKKKTAIPKANFRIEHHGSICLIVPLCASGSRLARRTPRQRQRISTVLADRHSRAALPGADHRWYSARRVGGAMSRKKEEPQGTSSVSFRVPDFVGEDGVEYTDIEVIVEMDGDIRDAANLADSLQRPVKNLERK